MSWHRLDAGYFSNPKVRRLSARAKCLDIAGIAYCNRELTDGVIANERLPIVLAEACATRAQLSELIVKGRWTQSASEVEIHHFKSSNPSADKVLKARAKHSELIKRLRKGACDQVTDQVTDPISDAQAEGKKVRGLEGNKAAVSSNGLLADSEDNMMPTQGDSITILEGWESIVGRPARLDEISHAGWLLDQYGDRLTANAILEVIERTHGRELTKGSPTHPLTYYDGPVRDAHAAAKPPRGPGIVHEIGEPLHLVAPRGVDAHGNPEPPEPLEIPA